MAADEDTLVLLWTSGNRNVALNMGFVYAEYSITEEWWEEVRIFIWGASTWLIKQDSELRERLVELKDMDGITVEACRICAEEYDAVDILEDLDIDVDYVGEDLTKDLKSDRTVLPI